MVGFFGDKLGRATIVLVRLLTIALAPVLLGGGCASLQDYAGTLGGAGPLDEKTVAAGLREALRVGTQRTVTSTSQVDGYLANELIRIVLPEDVTPIADTLRRLGFSATVNEFEVAMNRAAEGAAREAKDVFWSAITSMTIADAFGILNGGDTAATDYFQERTSADLRSRFQPVIDAKMGEVGTYRLYDELVGKIPSLPGVVEKPDLDLVGYVTEEALSGLFVVLGQEEKLIRDDPVARTTDLLKRVFGRE